MTWPFYIYHAISLAPRLLRHYCSQCITRLALHAGVLQMCRSNKSDHGNNVQEALHSMHFSKILSFFSFWSRFAPISPTFCTTLPPYIKLNTENDIVLLKATDNDGNGNESKRRQGTQFVDEIIDKKQHLRLADLIIPVDQLFTCSWCTSHSIPWQYLPIKEELCHRLQYRIGIKRH